MLIIAGGREIVLAGETFDALGFQPASIDDVRALQTGNGQAPAPAVPQLPPSGAEALVRAAGLAPATETITYDPAPVRRKHRPRPGKLTPSEIARAKQEWQDDKLTIGQIAQRLGVNGSAIHWHAKRHGWGKRPATAPRQRRGKNTGRPKGSGRGTVPGRSGEPHPASQAAGQTDVAGSAQADPTPAPAPVRITKDWELGKKLWLENKDVATIAAAVGVTTSAVYLHSKEWPARTAGTQVKTRRCHSCQLLTDRDPCHHCGAKWNKAWKDD